VTPSGEGNRFDYEVTSSATDKVLVYWYVPLTDDFKLDMDRSHPLTAARGEPVRRSARSSDPVGWTAAAVQIFDFDRRWLATGRASVYCTDLAVGMGCEDADLDVFLLYKELVRIECVIDQARHRARGIAGIPVDRKHPGCDSRVGEQ